MFKATLALLSKASRLPLNSKKANKNFYKGTRTPNMLVRKRIALANTKGEQLYDRFGRERTWNHRGYRLDEARVPAYVVPPGLAGTSLRPYVFCGPKDKGGVPRPDVGYPSGPKMPDTKGLNGVYYEAVSEAIWKRRDESKETDKDLRSAKDAAGR